MANHQSNLVFHSIFTKGKYIRISMKKYDAKYIMRFNIFSCI